VGLFSYPQQNWLSQLFIRLADYGRASVEVFFVVSGFAIAYSLRSAGSERLSLGRFMLRRAVRLDPPYWAALLLGGLVMAIRARVIHQPIELPPFGKVVAHVLYLQDILGFGQFNVVFWTLCLEFQLYLAFAVMMRSFSAVGDTPPESSAGVWAEADKYGWLMVAGFFLSLVLSHTVWPMRPGWFVPFFLSVLVGVTGCLEDPRPYFGQALSTVPLGNGARTGSEARSGSGVWFSYSSGADRFHSP